VSEFDDLELLERELGPSLRLALYHFAAEITDDGSTSPFGGNGDGAVATFVDVPLVRDSPETDRGVNATELDAVGGRRGRSRIRLIAGCLIAAGLVAALVLVGRNSRETQPAIAPSGGNGLIAFAVATGGNSLLSDIHVVAPDGSGLRALTSTPDLVEYAPTWSTDGTRLAFVRTTLPDSPAPCTTLCQLVVVDPSTGAEMFSADIPQPDGAGGTWVPSSLAWSPDGRGIVIPSVSCGVGGCGTRVYNTSASTPAEACGYCGGINSVIADLETGAFTTFVPPYRAVWSPDSEWLSLAQAPIVPGPSMALVPADLIETGDVVDVADLPGARPVPERPGDVWWDTVAWMPDSSALVFSLRGQIEVVTVGDGERRTLIEEGFDPVVSPDGRRIAYRREAASGDVTEIWVAAADGSVPRRVTSSLTPPVWSPDGTLILASDDEGWFAMRPDGTGRTAITPVAHPGPLTICCPDNRPSWQPLRTTVDSASNSTPVAGEPSTLVLDDFESGTLQGWQNASSGAGDWYVYRDGHIAPDPASSDLLDPFAVPDPPQGVFAVVTDTNNPGTHIVYRDVTLDGPLTLTMTVFYETNGPREDGLDVPFNTPATLRFDAPEANMQFRIDLLDPAAPIDSVAAGDVLVNLFHTAESDPAILEPTEITVDVSEHAGQTVRLRLAEVGNQAPIRAGVDNIRFEPLAPGAGIELPDDVDAS
jgi:Tol biopolymer transport system component